MNLKARTFAIGTALALGAASGVQAQTPPPGAIFNLHSVIPGNLSTFQQFNVSFIAAFANTTVSFAFREVPAYFGFDDASVSTGGGSNLLGDPGFESATDGQNIPTGWGRWIQPIDVTAIGEVDSPDNLGGCDQYGPHSGFEFWCDGSVEGYDALYQTIPTTIGLTYDISWWLSDNSDEATNDPEINMLAYATNGIPVGTIDLGGTPIPEPASMSMLAIGLVSVAGFARRRRRVN
jgi:hypothetical protein